MGAANAAIIAAVLAAILFATCLGSRRSARGAEGFQQKCAKNQEWIPSYGKCYEKCPPGSTRKILKDGKPGACWSDSPLPAPAPHNKPPPRAPPPPGDWVVAMKKHGLYEQVRRNDANAILDMAMETHGNAEGFDRRRLKKYIDHLAMNRRLNGAQFMYAWMQSKGNRDHIKQQREYTHARI